MKNQLGMLMQQMQQMQEQTAEKMQKIHVQGEAGAGLVTVTMNGNYEALSIHIDASLTQDDQDMLEDMVAAAINDANRKVKSALQESMSGMLGGMKLPF